MFALIEDMDVNEERGRFIPQDNDYRIRKQIRGEQIRMENDWQQKKSD